MSKWLSHSGSRDPRGWHLYPATHVSAHNQEMHKGEWRLVGETTAPAYCGAHTADGESVRELTTTKFDSIGEFARASDAPACSKCQRLVRSGNLTDPEWQADYRERNGESIDVRVPTRTVGLTSGSTIDVGGASTVSATDTSSTSSEPILFGPKADWDRLKTRVDAQAAANRTVGTRGRISLADAAAATSAGPDFGIDIDQIRAALRTPPLSKALHEHEADDEDEDDDE